MKKQRLAAVDIGTNSIRCIVVETTGNGKFRVLDDEKASVRLGEGLAQSGEISFAAWERGIETLSRMKKIIDGYGISAIEAVATSAVRKAANGEAFVAAVEARTGIRIRVIDGEEEAELAALSARNNFDMEGVRYAMVDIGGGSIEIVIAFGSHIEEIHSLELGAVFLTETFLKEDPVRESDYERLRKQVRKGLKERIGAIAPVHCLLGSGGTMTSLAAMISAMGEEEYATVHGYEVFRSQVVHLLAMLLRKDLKGLRAVPGLNPDRADIIVAGVAAVDELMRFFKANVLKVNERGIREGLILRGLREHGMVPQETSRRSWRDSSLEFARSCHFDEEHSLQVANLSLKIFDAVAPAFGLGAGERRLLEAAAILHDAGYLISYESHHKHSYLLIRHADLFGFTPREKELIANIARYHRKSLPKRSHQPFQRLSSTDRLLVERLGGILRLSDGLDRRRTSHLMTIDCALSGPEVTIRVRDSEDISVELFGGKTKGDLFERAFAKKLRLLEG